VLLGQVIKNWFWDSYDNLGRLIFYNLLWFVLSLPIVTLPAATAALFYVTNQMVTQKGLEVKDFFRAFKRYFFKSLLLFLIVVAVSFILYQDFRFFITDRMGKNWLSFLGAGISFWMIVFWFLMQIYLIPFFVSRNSSVFQTLKYSALLVLVNPLRTFFVLLFILVIIVLSVISAAGVVFLMMGLTSIMQHNLLVEVIRKHSGGDMEGEDRHAYRGWRDIIKPWE
jgi:uncharacterized membrane protein YesL